MASQQPIGDLLAAPAAVVDALVARLERQAEEREARDRQERLRNRLRQLMGR